MDANELMNKSRQELEDMANKKGIGGASEMDKDELIDALSASEEGGWGEGNPAEPGHGGGEGDTPPETDNPDDWKNEPGNQS